MENQTVKFIIVNVVTGKALQSWTFAGKKHIEYCTSPDWATPFPSMESAEHYKDYLTENFPNQKLTTMKLTKTVTYAVG